MTTSDVDSGGMDGNELTNSQVERLLAGAGADIDASLAAVLIDVRSSFASCETPAVGAALGAFLTTGQAGVVGGGATRRLSRLRARTGVKIAAAVAAAFATTGGLAAAGALPSSVQSEISHIANDVGINLPEGTPSHAHGSVTPHGPKVDDNGVGNDDGARGETSTSFATHGGVVSGTAHDHSVTGCDHGHAVAAVASGKTDLPDCTTTTEITDTTEPPSDAHGGGHQGVDESHGNEGGDQSTPTSTTPREHRGNGSISHGGSGPNGHANQGGTGSGATSSSSVPGG